MPRTSPVTPATTCQICGRPIKSKRGVIAHHGYKRPGDGWQTSSCQGARFAPYEESCDRIKEILPRLHESVQRYTELLAEMIANPPDTLTYEKYRGAWQQPERIPVTRPEGFTVDNADNWMYASNYSRAFRDLRRDREGVLRSLKGQIEFLTDRLAAWNVGGQR